MKKRNFVSLALLGMGMALLSTSCEKASGEEMDPEMKTFYEQLTPDAQVKFRQLDTEHKKAAMKILELGCKADNQCKGHREHAVEHQYQLQMKEQRVQKSDQMKRD